MTFGREIAGQQIDSNIIVILFLVLPVFILVIQFFKRFAKYHDVSVAVSSILYLLVLTYVFDTVKKTSENYFLELHIEKGLIIAVILNVGMIGVAVLDTIVSEKLIESTNMSRE